MVCCTNPAYVGWEEVNATQSANLDTWNPLVYPPARKKSFGYFLQTMRQLRGHKKRAHPNMAVIRKKKRGKKSDIFSEARRQHSGVETCINNLEIRGLSRCLSYGRDGFEQHVALSIVVTNLHRIGLLLQRK